MQLGEPRRGGPRARSAYPAARSPGRACVARLVDRGRREALDRAAELAGDRRGRTAGCRGRRARRARRCGGPTRSNTATGRPLGPTASASRSAAEHRLARAPSRRTRGPPRPAAHPAPPTRRRPRPRRRRARPPRSGRRLTSAVPRGPPVQRLEHALGDFTRAEHQGPRAAPASRPSPATSTAAELTEPGWRPSMVSRRTRRPGDQRGRRRSESDHPIGGAGGARRVVGPAHLAEDLGLAQDLRVESGGDGEEVAHRLLAVEPQQRLTDVGAPAQREVPEPGLEVEVSGPVDLAAIAGGKQEGGAAGGGLTLEPGRRLQLG